MTFVSGTVRAWQQYTVTNTTKVGTRYATYKLSLEFCTYELYAFYSSNAEHFAAFSDHVNMKYAGLSLVSQDVPYRFSGAVKNFRGLGLKDAKNMFFSTVKF